MIPRPPTVQPVGPTEEELAVQRYVEKIVLSEEVGEARSLLGEMRSEGLPLVMDAWKAALGVCANASSASEPAMQLLEEMTKERLTPDHECYHFAMDAGIKDQGAGGNFVADLLKEMERRALMPTQESYTRVLRSHIQNGNERFARRIFREATRKGLLPCWQNRGLVLQLAEWPIDVATFILRVAVVDRARELGGRRKAGKTTMHVLTREAGVPKQKDEGGRLEREVLRILKEEYGLKARAEPSDFGRIRIRGSELERLGLERKGLPVKQKVGR